MEVFYLKQKMKATSCLLVVVTIPVPSSIVIVKNEFMKNVEFYKKSLKV